MSIVTLPTQAERWDKAQADARTAITTMTVVRAKTADQRAACHALALVLITIAERGDKDAGA